MRYIQNKGIVIRRVDDSVFLVNPQTDALYQMDGAGSVLWLALSESLDHDEAAKLLLIAFPDADPEIVARDVDAVLKDLLDHNLIAQLE